MKPPTSGSAQSTGRLVRQADEQEADRDREDERAEVIEVARGAGPLDRRQEPPDHDQADDADRQVDEEDPVPADAVGQEAAEARPDEERDPEDRSEEALVLAAFGRREEVADDREGDREEGAGAEALDAAEQDQLPHFLAEA